MKNFKLLLEVIGMTVDKQIQIFKHLLKDKENIVFFGGAGVSTASGIPDFRSPSGLYSEGRNAGRPWNTYVPETLLSHSFFMEHTDWFYEYYKENVLHPEARPSTCHNVLAKWEEVGKLRAVITQNIDGLHQLAGSREVVELHGTTWENYCMTCGADYPLDYVIEQEGIPYCDLSHCKGIVRPNVTLYEEQLPPGSMEKAIMHIQEADLLIIAGTSLAVYPAAGLIHYFRGQDTVLINLGPTPMDNEVSLPIQADINLVFSELDTIF